jgi:hypothetical protein
MIAVRALLGDFLPRAAFNQRSVYSKQRSVEDYATTIAMRRSDKLLPSERSTWL